MKTGSHFQDNTNLPVPFYNSSGKKVLEFISQIEIQLDLPFIMTRNKRLIINMPYLKTERKLTGNDISVVRLLSFETSDEIIQLKIQELESKKTYTIEWNMDYTNSYWIWCLADFSTILGNTIKTP